VAYNHSKKGKGYAIIRGNHELDQFVNLSVNKRMDRQLIVKYIELDQKEKENQEMPTDTKEQLSKLMETYSPLEEVVFLVVLGKEYIACLKRKFQPEYLVAKSQASEFDSMESMLIHIDKE